jgi:uncharacterized membrane protein
MLLLLGLLLQSPYIQSNQIINPSETSTGIFAQYKLQLFVVVIVFSVSMFLLSLRQMVRFTILIGIPYESFKNISKEYLLLTHNKTTTEEKVRSNEFSVIIPARDRIDLQRGQLSGII